MLKEKIQNDVKEALKNGDAEKRLVLNLVLSAIKGKELEKRTKLSRSESDISKLEEQSRLNDQEVLDVITSEVKKRKESIDQYEKGRRTELAEKEKKELEILSEYMPEQMSEDAVREEVKKAISETGAKEIKEMGKVLGVLMPKLKGKADGQTVSKIVKEELSQ